MNAQAKLNEVHPIDTPDLAQVQKSISKSDKSVGPSGAARRRYRTIWISNVHLGTRGCNDGMLIDFLHQVDSETLYLAGDIVDGWRMKKRYYWPERHNAIVRRIMKRAKRGTDVIYILGNHDEMFRQFAGMNFGGVQIRKKPSTARPMGGACRLQLGGKRTTVPRRAPCR